MELTYVKFLLENRENCESSKLVINDLYVGDELDRTLKAIRRFYEETGEDTGDRFEEWAQVRLQGKEKEVVLTLVQKARELPSEGVTKAILDHLKRKQRATEIACHAEDFLNGDDTAYERMLRAVEKALEQEDSGIEPAPDDLDSILEGTITRPGIPWRLEELNMSLGPLRQGDFVIVGARVETGKTTFLASESTYMLDFVENPILWVNNEEDSRKVILRLYEAYFGKNKDWILENKEQASREFPKGKIKVVEPTFYWEVEQLCKQYKPSLIIFDVLDKIEGFQGEREDIRYGYLYRWARQLAKRYAPVIATSQCTGDAEGRRYPSLSMLDGSRTAKQKEADAIIMIGKDNDSEYLRYLSVPKNKLAGGPQSVEEYRHGRFEVVIEPTIARYRSL